MFNAFIVRAMKPGYVDTWHKDRRCRVAKICDGFGCKFAFVL